jgi:hypothetical protein
LKGICLNPKPLDPKPRDLALAGVELEDRLPPNEYLEYYGPGFRLQPPVPKDKPNTNSAEYLEEVSDPRTAGLSLVQFLARHIGYRYRVYRIYHIP